MSQLSIQSPLVGQTLATAPTQGPSVASAVQEMPVAMLARLSGSSTEKRAFDPARLHEKSYLHHVAEELAQRPLGDSVGARAAAEALELVESVQGKPVTKEHLAKLEELRTRAWQNDETGVAGNYCDTLAKVLLLRPMMEKLETVHSPEARAQLADVLHSQMERLLSVTTQQDFEQIKSELRATRELYKQEGMLGAEQETAFGRLDELLSYRQNYMMTLNTLQKNAEHVKNREASAPQLDNVLHDVEALRGNRMETDSASSVPPLRPGFQPLQTEAENLASELYNLSKEEAGKLSNQIDALLAQIRNFEAPLADVDKKIGDLRAELGKKAGVLTENDRHEFQRRIDRLAGAVEVRGRVARGENALRQVRQGGITAPQLEALQAELSKGIDALALYEDDRGKLNDILKQMGNKSSELRESARQAESQFATGIEREIGTATTPERYVQLAQEIDARLERLENLPDNGNLSPKDKDDAAKKLKELAQQCFMKEFTVVLADAESTRLNAPSVAQCAEHLDEQLGPRGIDREEIRAKLKEKSGEASNELGAKIADLKAKVPTMTVEQLRTLPLTDIAEAMERRLLPEDRATLDQELSALISLAEETIFEETVGQDLEGTGAFGSLNEPQKATLRELCIRGGCHPSLIAALKDAAKGNGLEALLEAAANLFEAQRGDGTPAPKDSEQLDAFLLPHPELDDVARSILGNGSGEPDYRFDSARNSRDLGIYMDRHFPKALKHKLGLQENAPVGVDTLKNLVQQAANAHGRQGRTLKKVDLTLIQALWYAEKAQKPDLSFEAFKQGLPRPFNTMPMLKEHLAAGISGRRDLKKLGETVEGISHGLGSKKALVRFLTQAQASDPKWAAGAALSGLYRSLGFNPHSNLTGVFQDAVQDTRRRTAEQKKQGARTAVGAAHDLRRLKAEAEDANNAIISNPVRNEMANRLGISSETRDPNIKGATLATGILMAERILSDPNTSNEQKQKLLNCIHFQGQCELGGKKMKGSSKWILRKSDEQGAKFRKALRILRDKDKKIDLSTQAGQTAFNNARKTILDMCKDMPSSEQKTEGCLELRKRAEAVLFFKCFESDSAQDQINYKFTAIEDGKSSNIGNLTDTERDLYESYKKDVSEGMRTVIGTAQKQNKVLATSQNSQSSLRQDVNETLANAQAAYTKEEQKTLSKAAALVVCEQFLQTPDLTTEAALKEKYEEHLTITAPLKKLTDWDFYKNCLDQLTGMGIPEEHAELYLQRTLDGMEENFFADLAQKGLQGADTYTEIDRLVGAYMGELEKPGNSLTFKKTEGVSVDVPIVEAGAAEISAHLEVARENGISIWKGEDGQYHMTLMKGAKVGLGVGVEVELDSVISALEAQAGVNIQGGKGCDLTFPNQAQCHMFLSAILSGRAGTEHLGLCNGARIVTEMGVGASAGLKLGGSISVDDDVDIVSASIGAEAEISGLWTTTRNRDQIQHTRTVHGVVSVMAEVSLGTEDIQDAAEAIGDELDNMAYVAEEGFGRGDIADTLQEAKPQLSVEATLFRREFEEKRSVTTNAGNGTLEGAERVRGYVMNSKRETAALLQDAGVSPQTIRDVLADLQKLSPGEDFRIELVSTMRKDAVQGYNAASTSGEKPHIHGSDFTLREVRLVTEDTFERNNSLNLRLLKLQSGRSLNRTHTESYNAKPVLEQAA